MDLFKLRKNAKPGDIIELRDNEENIVVKFEVPVDGIMVNRDEYTFNVINGGCIYLWHIFSDNWSIKKKKPIKINPCLACGSKMVDSHGKPNYRLICSKADCPVGSCSYSKKDKLIEDWNAVTKAKKEPENPPRPICPRCDELMTIEEDHNSTYLHCHKCGIMSDRHDLTAERSMLENWDKANERFAK